ncbi:MAG: hypothetical protein Q7R31_00485 [Candidatus Levybacteria bacterium]|nr:hypothetical protein [Candidatus Levybacteria bacterium]
MKKNLSKFILFFFSLFFIFHFSFFISVSAATPTPNATDQIKQDLINNIASKVAQLKLVEKRGIVGKVSDVSNTQVTLSDLAGRIRFVDVDELTKFSSPNAKGSFGISDISKGDTLEVLGLYNKESRRLLGRFVNVISLPTITHGVIISIDSKNFNFSVATDSNKILSVDIETTTKILSYTKDAGLARLGFSKVKENQNIIIVGNNLYIFPNIPKNPNITVAQEALSPNQAIIPSTGSGKKLTPITK